MGEPTTTLKEAFQVYRVKPGYYKAFIAHDLCFRTAAHGGHLATLIQLAFEHCFRHDYPQVNHPYLLDLHISYIRWTRAGEVAIQITNVKPGPVVTSLQFTLSQSSKVNMVGIATHTNFDIPSPNYLITFPYNNTLRLQPPPPPPPQFSKLPSNTEPNWYNCTWKLEPDLLMRLLPQLRFCYPNPETRVSQLADDAVECWVGWQDPEQKFHLHHLGLLADISLPLPESLRPHSPYGKPLFSKSALNERIMTQRRGREAELSPQKLPDVGYPTLSMTLEIKRALPDEGVSWLYLRSTVGWISQGKWDMQVVICDEQMNLVALSRHVNLMTDLVKQFGSKIRGGDEKL